MFHSHNNNGSNGGGTSSYTTDVANQLVAQTIPNDLKRLIRTIMRTFYGFELYLCMEMLMIYPCIKEEDLAELLRLDLKTLQQHMKNLRKEKFINEKALMETSQDGNRQCKQSYFYINYKMVVNVIKYKLDRIRQQIEVDDKQFTTRAQFKCTQCSKTYTDLDTKDIFLTMRCGYCGADIDEDASSMPSRSSRNLMHTFNTQMSEIFELLSKVEHIRLADHLLRPEPIDITYILDRLRGPSLAASASSQNLAKNGDKNGAANNGMGGGGKSAMIKYEKWSGERTRNTDLFSQTKVSINFDSGDGSGSTNGSQRKPKELPSILLLNRTQEEDYSTSSKDSNNRDSMLLASVKLAADETILNQNLTSPPAKSNEPIKTNNSAIINTGLAGNGNVVSGAPVIISNGAANQNSNNMEQYIMQMLLKFEKKSLNDHQPTISNSNNTSIAQNGNSATSPKNSQPQLASSQQQLNNTSSLNLNGLSVKKRIHENEYSKTSANNHDTDYNYLKRRRLNNGEEEKAYRHNNSYKRNYSDGSDNSDEYEYEDDEYENFYDQPDSIYGKNNPISYDSYDSSTNNDQDISMPKITVRNRSVPFDRITPKLINLMNDREKENYINICRQLYTEIYEI